MAHLTHRPLHEMRDLDHAYRSIGEAMVGPGFRAVAHLTRIGFGYGLRSYGKTLDLLVTMRYRLLCRPKMTISSV